MQRWIVVAGRFAFVVAVAAAWEVAARLGWTDADVLPPLSKVLATLWRLFADRRFVADLGVTATEVIAAFVIVGPLSLAVGFLMGESRKLERMFGPTLQLLMAVPKSIFLPVFILLLGIGFIEKVVFAIVLAFFIVVPTGIAAVHSVPRGFVVAARSFGATRAQIYTQIYLPAMAPLVVGGLRLGLIFSVHAIVFAEMYAAPSGVGRDILTWGESFQMSYLLAAVLLVVTFTIVLNEALQACETYSRKRLGLAAEA
jgi:ABC-type nitrate/sulfonate/bicarbonate transport system permease component